MLTLVLLVFGRLFPLVPSRPAPPTPGGIDSPRRRKARIGATAATAVMAFALITLGLLDSFRLLSGGELDPVIPYSPVIFAVGVILFFSTAIVYELFPSSIRSP